MNEPNSLLAQAAAEHGTPLYVYSLETIRQRCRRIQAAFSSHPTLLCYAVKANSNLTILRTIFQEGFGADVVSEGELLRSLHSGASPNQIVFSGVGKRKAEIHTALENEILSFNVESLWELDAIENLAAELGKKALVSLRLNPNIPVKTNPYIATGIHKTKFGIPEKLVPDALKKLKSLRHTRLIGLSCHLGSQVPNVRPYEQALERLLSMEALARKAGFQLELLDIGGGFPIPYKGEKFPEIEQFAEALIKRMKSLPYRLVLEPGRWIMGPSGVLVTQVIGRKVGPQRTFVIVDAAMNDLIRPSLYSAFHEITPIGSSKGKKEIVDIVGPVCETGDYLGLKRSLPILKAGDLLAIENAGAYGMSMASNYNSRPRTAEVLLEDGAARVIRTREAVESLWINELV